MVRALLSGIVLVLLALLGYGIAIEPRLLLDERPVETEIPGLPAEWDGRRVALLADFQIGMWLDNVGMAKKAVETAIGEDVSLVLLAGDFVYCPDPSGLERATVDQAIDERLTSWAS